MSKETLDLKNYIKIAHFVYPHLKDGILQIYHQCIEKRPPEDYLYDHYMNVFLDSRQEINLENIVIYALCTALSKDDIDKAVRTAKMSRRTWKKNWMTSIRNEMGLSGSITARNPQYLRTYAGSQVTKAIMDGQKDVPDIQHIMEETYQKLEQWARDGDAPAMNFIFRHYKQPKALANAFLTDITYDSLCAILLHYHGSIEGFNMNVPTVLSDYPIFSYRQADMFFDPVVVQNELTLLSQYDFQNENTMGKIEVKYGSEQMPINLQKQTVEDVLSNYQININEQRDLDMRDREIITHLFSMINASNLDHAFITVNTHDFCKSVFNLAKPRGYNYEDVYKRLTKLKQYSYSVSVIDKKTNEPAESIHFNLIDSLYINYEQGYFQFRPSDMWIRTYVQQKYTSILTDSYKSISSPQTKAIMMLLQQERLIGYSNGVDTKNFTLSYFRSRMKMLKVGNSAFMKELKQHLSTLQDNHVIVKDFEVLNRGAGIRVTFLPLNDAEKLAYDYNDALTSGVLTSSHG